MRNRLIGSIVALLAVLTWTGITFCEDASETKQSPAKAQPASARDIYGTWMGLRIGATTEGPPPFQPWAEQKFKELASKGEQRNLYDPRRSCFPLGMPRNLFEPVPIELVQAPDRVLILFENDHIMSQIYMNLTEHPKDLSPTWMGHSIGKWDGDTLVVDTVELRKETWLDGAGLPHSEDLHLVQRIHRVDADTLEDLVTIDDPKAYTKSWTMDKIYKLKPGWHIIEYVCEDEWSDKLDDYYNLRLPAGVEPPK